MQAPSSCLIMIGIANSIDLTERSLPQLQALGCKPALVTFPSYSSEELVKLLAQRQAQLPGPAFQEIALRLCARMVRASACTLRCAELRARHHFIYSCTLESKQSLFLQMIEPSCQSNGRNGGLGKQIKGMQVSARAHLLLYWTPHANCHFDSRVCNLRCIHVEQAARTHPVLSYTI